MCFSSSFSSLSPPTRLVVTSVNDPLRNQLPGKEKCTHASLNFFAAYVHCPFFIFPIIFLFSFCLWHLLFVCVFLTYVLCAFFPRVSGIFLIFLPASSSIHHHCATFLSLVFLWPSSFWRTLHIFPRLFRRVKRTKQKLSWYTNAIATDGRCEKTPKDNNKTKWQ